MRNKDGRYSLMFEEWVQEGDFIISPRIMFEVRRLAEQQLLCCITEACAPTTFALHRAEILCVKIPCCILQVLHCFESLCLTSCRPLCSSQNNGN
jgi:hypothetical protein